MLALEIADFWLAGKWVSGTFNPVVSNPGAGNYKSWNVSAGDGDTLMVFNHGFISTPDMVFVQVPTSVAALANWGVTANATQIILTKLGVVGSGGSPAVKVFALTPHSIMQ